MGSSISGPDNLTMRENSGANVGTRPRLNVIEGTSITLTTADDGTNNEVAVTVAFSGHLIGTTSTPSIVKGGAVGSGSATIAGTDLSGTITATTAGLLTGGVVATITFATAFAAAPKAVHLSGADVNGASKITAVYATTLTTTTWVLSVASGSLAGGTTYTWYYLVV